MIIFLSVFFIFSECAFAEDNTDTIYDDNSCLEEFSDRMFSSGNFNISDDLREVERRFIADYCDNGRVDMKDFYKDYGSRCGESDQYVDSKILIRSSFVSSLISWGDIKNNIFINCVFVDGDIDLSHNSVGKFLYIDSSVVYGDLDFSRSIFDRGVIISNSHISGNLMSDSAKFEDIFFIEDSNIDSLRFIGARVGSQLSLNGTVIRMDARGDGSTIQESFFAKNLKVSGDFIIRGMDVNGNMELDSALIGGQLDAENLSLSGSLFIREDFRSEYVDLKYAIIDRNITFRRSDIGRVSLLDASIGASVDLSDCTVRDELYAVGINVGRVIEASGSNFGSFIALNSSIGAGLSIVDSIINGELDLDNSRIESFLYLRNGSNFENLSLSGLQVLGDIELQGSHVNGDLFLESARVTGEVVFALGKDSPVTWGNESIFWARGSQTGSIISTEEVWFRSDGSPLSVDLSGYTYTDIKDPSPSTDVGWFMDIISNQYDKNDVFDPRPYEQLAKVYRNNGNYDLEKETRSSMYWHYWDEGEIKFFDRFSFIVGYLLVDHGIRPFRSMYWIIALIISGWAFYVWRGMSAISGVTEKFWFSLENSIPLISISYRYSEISEEDEIVRGVIHLQKILGFLIATVLVGALTILGS